ncbi:hypothetical protein A3Q56_00456 [Intoshia linei]|uniref:receptor protein-tyrosine kinase n=1 Tax=Intoshia linei TaxID=1819745 RepID=A0A177BC52_9BILA|nr:hypothetical protein A3Q56_00456 [Intoshia linei]
MDSVFMIFFLICEAMINSNNLTEKSLQNKRINEINHNEKASKRILHSTNINIRENCAGTSNGNAYIYDDDNYNYYKKLWINCISVNGNVELINVTNVNGTINYLSSLIEIKGYLSIRFVNVLRINLSNLVAIRGNYLYDSNAIYVSNSGYNSLMVNRKRMIITMPKILYIGGNVKVSDSMIGHWEHKIGWTSLLSKKSENFFSDQIDDPTFNIVSIKDNESINIVNKNLKQSEKCHEKCKEINYCWGDLEHDCFKSTTKCKLCPGICMNNGTCCSDECIGGCTGTSAKDCFLCKNVSFNNICTSQCPSHEITQYGESVDNPIGKYYLLYSSVCVLTCPHNMVHYKTNCVRTCPKSTTNVDGVCLNCSIDKSNNLPLCEKSCDGNGEYDSMHYDNLPKYENCTVITKNIVITSDGIKKLSSGVVVLKDEEITTELFKPLENIKIISGYLYIHLQLFGKYKSIRFLQNLQSIYGHSTILRNCSIYIVRTNLESLGMKSLKKIHQGNVCIYQNPNLCFIETIDWRSMLMTNGMVYLNNNISTSKCKRLHQVCYHECDSKGCFGKTSDQCLKCKNYITPIGECTINCENYMNYYTPTDGTMCGKCNSECKDGRGCTGGSNTQCKICKNVKYQNECIQKCSTNTFPTAIGSETICQHCHTYCKNGCTGLKYCKPCHNTCKSCNGQSMFNCTRCKYFYTVKNEETAVVYTSISKIESNNSRVNCSTFCKGKSFKSNNFKFCINDTTIIIWSSKDVGSITSSIVVLFLVAITIGLIFFYIKRKKRKKRKKMFTMELDDKKVIKKLLSTSKSSNEGGVADMTKLRVITENELEMGQKIGTGAFGTVYQCIWKPKNEKIRIPVAAKVLQNSDDIPQTIDEIHIMASVRHNYVLSLLGVLIREQVILITQLMSTGCLLNFLKKKRDSINAEILIKWAIQISDGMNYLHSKNIIHRDLAARNILLHNTGKICITDFGLSKLMASRPVRRQESAPEPKRSKSLRKLPKFLSFRKTPDNRRNYSNNHSDSVSEGIIQAEEKERLPIRWLAPESLKKGEFSQKSDVWSFGVTIWEMLTFGKIPYNEMKPKQIYSRLNLGERLPQPDIASLDVYLIMIRCWITDAQSRPPFTFLKECFEDMQNDPTKFLRIEVDTKIDFFSPENIDDDVMEADDYMALLINQVKPKKPLRNNKNVKLDTLEKALDDKITRDATKNESDKKSYRYMTSPFDTKPSLSTINTSPSLKCHVKSQNEVFKPNANDMNMISLSNPNLNDELSNYSHKDYDIVYLEPQNNCDSNQLLDKSNKSDSNNSQNSDTSDNEYLLPM